MPALPTAFYLRGKNRVAQLDLCLEYAKLSLGFSGEYLVFEDDGLLGGELPGLAQLRTVLSRRSVSAVVCEEMATLCRTTAELLDYARLARESGAALAFARDRLDLSSPQGQTLLYAAETLIELERKTAAAHIRENMLALARTGRWLGGVTPTGYTSRRVPALVAGEKIYKLELHPEQSGTVRLIFALFLETDSLAKVTKALADQGIRTKNGRSFSRFTVRQILENPVYVQANGDAYDYFARLGAELCSPKAAFDGSRGMMVYNKTAQLAGQPNHHREPSQWIAAVGEHEGLIDAASWIAAQQQLSRNKSKTARRPKSDHGLLAELLFCGDCGAHMRPKLGRRREGQAQDFYYICEHKERSRSGECDIPNLKGDFADRSLDAVLAALDPGEPDVLPPEPKRPAGPEATQAHRALIAQKQEEIAQNDRDISGLVFSLIKAIDKNAYEEIIKQIDLLHQQGRALRAQVEDLEALLGPSPLEDTYRDALKWTIAHWGENTHMAMARRRAALRVLLDRVTWDGEELLVKFAGGAAFAVKPY